MYPVPTNSREASLRSIRNTLSRPYLWQTPSKQLGPSGSFLPILLLSCQSAGWFHLILVTPIAETGPNCGFVMTLMSHCFHYCCAHRDGSSSPSTHFIRPHHVPSNIDLRGTTVVSNVISGPRPIFKSIERATS